MEKIMDATKYLYGSAFYRDADLMYKFTFDRPTVGFIMVCYE
jgi:hypothetical protein